MHHKCSYQKIDIGKYHLILRNAIVLFKYICTKIKLSNALFRPLSNVIVAAKMVSDKKILLKYSVAISIKQSADRVFGHLQFVPCISHNTTIFQQQPSTKLSKKSTINCIVFRTKLIQFLI
jgi:predicted membrane protein